MTKKELSELTGLKSLEVLKQLKDFVLEFTKNDLDRKFINGSFDIIKKELEALEIIKEHRFLFVEKGQLYVGRCCDVELLLEEDDFQDEQEYELLKEVFGNGI